MSVFSDVKDAMQTQLSALFTAASLNVTIVKYRTFDWSEATNTNPLLILSANSFDQELAEAGLRIYVDIVASTIVRYGNEAEAAAAETALDNIDGVIIGAYRADGGTYQKAAGAWRAVNFYQPSLREPSPRGTEGVRYAESYLRFYV